MQLYQCIILQNVLLLIQKHLEVYGDEPSCTDTSATASIHAANNIAAFTFKQKIADKADDGGTKDVEILVILKYLSNFWRTLEIPIIN